MEPGCRVGAGQPEAGRGDGEHARVLLGDGAVAGRERIGRALARRLERLGLGAPHRGDRVDRRRRAAVLYPLAPGAEVALAPRAEGEAQLRVGRGARPQDPSRTAVAEPQPAAIAIDEEHAIGRPDRHPAAHAGPLVALAVALGHGQHDVALAVEQRTPRIVEADAALRQRQEPADLVGHVGAARLAVARDDGVG